MKHRRPKTSGASPQANPPPISPTGWKLWRWRLLSATLVPLLMLIFVEGALRLLGFGYPTSFLLSATNHGQKTLVQNNEFGFRFFGKRKSRTPGAISILRQKPPDVVRIFVFGESAAFGDPQPSFGVSRVLQAMMSVRHPNQKFEVINTAMTAIDSHVVLPIARDCANAGGDVWVIYMGNNEVVGPFGAGTVFGTQALPLPAVRATLALKSTRIGQMFDTVREQWHAEAPDKNEWGGMLMFLGNQVPADDSRLNNVRHSFAENLHDIIRIGHDSGAGVVVSTVAVNLKTCPPFASKHRSSLSQSDQTNWDQQMRAGIEAQSEGKFSEAAQLFASAAKLDDSYAELQYRLGICQIAIGNVSIGQKSLQAARNLDTLRFRCDSQLNDLIRKSAIGREGDRILLADAEDSFAKASPAGVPGWDLFYEHVHLTFAGNYLLARTFAEQIENLLPQSSGGEIHPWPSAAECAKNLGWTERDARAAYTDILGRLTDPPFSTQINHEEQVQYLTQRLRATTETTLTAALEITRAAVKSSPNDAQLYLQLGTLEQASGNIDKAESAATQSVDLLPSSTDAWSQLGMVFVQQKKFTNAVDAFQHAFSLNPQDVWPLQNLAMSLEKLGRTNDALREFNRALSITPRFGLAWLSKGQLLENMGREKDASECFKQALQNRIHRSPELTSLARFCMSRGWYDAAVTNFDQAVELDPSDADLSVEAGRAHFLFGSSLGNSGQPALAAVQFRQAVKLMPEVIEARLNLAIALFKAQQWKESQQQFEQVTQSSPTNALARRYLETLRQKTTTTAP